MTEILLILLAASGGLALAKFLRLPSAPLLILAGGGLDYLDAPINSELAKDALLLGLTFLVFLSGTALNPWRIGEKSKVAFFLGGLQFLVLGGFGYLLCVSLNFNLLESLYLALALASSSTLVVIKLLQSRGELFEPFGRLMVGALLVQDLLIIMVISGLSNFGEGKIAILSSTGLMIVLAGLGVVCKKWVVPWLINHPKMDEEQQLILALSLLFLFMGISSAFNLPFLTGAFVAGISLSSFPVNGILKGQFASLNNFFSAVFFVTLGLFVDFVPPADLPLALGLAALIIFLTPALAATIAWLAGLSFRTGVEGGLLLSQTSEFSIILALIGMENGHLGQEHLNLVTSITVSTMILTPFLSHDFVASTLLKLSAKLSFKKIEKIQRSEHCVLFGCGESGMVVLEKLLQGGLSPVVVDDDLGVVRKVREMGVETVLGNGKDPNVMKRANLEKASLVVSSMRKFSDNKAVLRSGVKAPKVIRVFDHKEADEVARLGGISIPVTDAASEELLHWIDNHLSSKGQ